MSSVLHLTQPLAVLLADKQHEDAATKAYVDALDVMITAHDAAGKTFTIERTQAAVEAGRLPDYHRPPGDLLVHHRGELQVGPRIRVWCVCGFKWEGEGRRAAEKAWEEHLA